jgi:hypothetical protein
MTENTPTKKDKPEPRRLDGKPKTRRVGQIIARGPNKWLTRIFRGYKPDGQNDYFNKTFHGTKTDAEKWLRGALAWRRLRRVLAVGRNAAE